MPTKKELEAKIVELLEHEMVLIPAGEFMMGALPDDGDARDNEKPCNKVEITKDFYVGKYPVTQKLWESVMGDNPSYFKGEDRPVEKVSWFDCVQFCNKLSEKEGREAVYTIDGENVSCNWNANGYRLLSEAEWEYCARANQTFLYSGSNNPDEVAWYDENSGDETHSVGQKKPNGFGLYDMSGNVYEWCWDWYDFSIYGSHADRGTVRDPYGAKNGSSRVHRGGSWRSGAGFTRVSNRYYVTPDYEDVLLGFRLGCTP